MIALLQILGVAALIFAVCGVFAIIISAVTVGPDYSVTPHNRCPSCRHRWTLHAPRAYRRLKRYDDICLGTIPCAPQDHEVGNLLDADPSNLTVDCVCRLHEPTPRKRLRTWWDRWGL